MSIQTLVEDIVQRVREKIIRDRLYFPKGYPWNEEAGGGAWLDNEVGMAIQLLRKIWPTYAYPNWDNRITVPQYQEAMMTLSRMDLLFIREYVKLGGTSVLEAFELRDKSREEILTWFKNHGVIVSNQMCRTCHTEKQIKKCSICLTTYYCSTECQKKDWKTHKKTCKKEGRLTLSRMVLLFIRSFVEMGGPTMKELFELREKSKEEVLTWFKKRGFVFPERICAICRTDGKLKKCSICRTTYYCSTACQKKGWKTHKKTHEKE